MNRVLVEHGSVRVHYDHWAACDLSGHLVLGLDHTLRWVRQQEFVGDHPNGGWMDELWASGGLTVDLDRHRLVWFGVPRGRVGGLAPDSRNPSADVTTDVDPSEMPAALTDFLDEFTRAHLDETVHPAIQAMNLMESLLGLPGGALNPAIADHHPLAGTAEEVAAVVAHAAELMSHYLAAERCPANPPDLSAT